MLLVFFIEVFVQRRKEKIKSQIKLSRSLSLFFLLKSRDAYAITLTKTFTSATVLKYVNHHVICFQDELCFFHVSMVNRTFYFLPFVASR